MKRALLVSLIAVVLGFFPAHGAADSRDLRDGFYLIRHTCEQESQVRLLPVFKTTPPAVTSYVKSISDLADTSLQTLDRLSAHDRSLRDGTGSLPAFETATRASIRADKQHLLLFGTKGPLFARRFLFTQIEASNYITHLAKVWAERDPDADRAATMRKMSARWLKIRDEGFRLLDAS